MLVHFKILNTSVEREGVNTKDDINSYVGTIMNLDLHYDNFSQASVCKIARNQLGFKSSCPSGNGYPTCIKC